MRPMAAGTKTGKAYVEIDASTKGFAPKVIQLIRSELRKAEPAARAGGRAIGREIADGIVQGMRRRMGWMVAEIRTILRAVESGATIHVDVEVDATTITRARSQVDNMGRDIETSLRRMGGRYLGPLIGSIGAVLSGTFPKIATFLGSLKTVMGGAIGNATGLAMKIYMIYAALLTVTGAFNAVGREVLNLTGLIGLIPGALAVTAAIAAPLMLSLRGVGDAMTAVWSGDKKKTDAALKGLSSSAKEVVLELGKTKTFVTNMIKSVQEGMFAPLKGVFSNIMFSIGNTVTVGMTKVSTALGMFFRTVGDKIATPQFSLFLDKLFTTASNLINVLSGPALNLFLAFQNMANASLPIIDQLGTISAGLIQKFADWINKKVDSGEFAKWIDDGLVTLRELKNLIGEVGLLLSALFDEANQDGESFIVSITNLIIKMREFAESKEGEYALKGIAAAANIAMYAILGVAYGIGVIIAALGSLVAAVKDALNWLHLIEGTEKHIKRRGEVLASSGVLNLAPRANGGIIDRPTAIYAGEAGREVVIPLTRPSRARQLADQSGLTGMLGGGGGGDTYVFYLGEEQVDARMVRVARNVNDTTARAATYRGLATA